MNDFNFDNTGKESIYSKQILEDKVTNGNVILVHKWENFKTTFDIHVTKDNNPLFDHLLEYEKALLVISFVPTDGLLRMGIQRSREDKEKFLHITEYVKVICTPGELIYKDVRGEFLDNFEVMVLTNKRNEEYLLNNKHEEKKQ